MLGRLTGMAYVFAFTAINVALALFNLRAALRNAQHAASLKQQALA